METAIVLAGIIATAAVAGLVWAWLQIAALLARVVRLEGRLLAPGEQYAMPEPERRDEYAPDAVLDSMADAEWFHNFQPPDGWRQ